MHAWLVGLLGSVGLIIVPRLALCITTFDVSHLIVPNLKLLLQIGLSGVGLGLQRSLTGSEVLSHRVLVL